jgi:hypothetical protein
LRASGAGGVGRAPVAGGGRGFSEVTQSGKMKFPNVWENKVPQIPTFGVRVLGEMGRGGRSERSFNQIN